MAYVKKDERQGEERIIWAINFLFRTFQELEQEYPDYEVLDSELQTARRIVHEHPRQAARRALEKIASVDYAAAGYNIMYLIQGLESNSTPEWVSFLYRASTDMREEVSTTAKEALAIIGKDERNIPVVNETTPETVTDSHIKELVSILFHDREEEASAEDVLVYQDVVGSLSRLLSDRNVTYMVPLFTHPYWRVRKHAVLIAKNIFPRLTDLNINRIRMLLHSAANDVDTSVKAMAQTY